MEFCPRCGSRLTQTADGYWCHKCHRQISLKSDPKPVRSKDSFRESIIVVEKSEEERAKIHQTCPTCGNEDAYFWLSSSSGEHAGVKQERALQHFECAKCGYKWHVES